MTKHYTNEYFQLVRCVVKFSLLVCDPNKRTTIFDSALTVSLKRPCLQPFGTKPWGAGQHVPNTKQQQANEDNAACRKKVALKMQTQRLWRN